MSDKIKTELISAGNTFLSTFILAVATTITSTGGVEWSLAFWGAVALAALRVAIKAVINSFVPERLGGRK